MLLLFSIEEVALSIPRLAQQPRKPVTQSQLTLINSCRTRGERESGEYSGTRRGDVLYEEAKTCSRLLVTGGRATATGGIPGRSLLFSS